LDEVALLAAICDNARLNLFDLTDTALNGDRARMARVIAGLAGEGTAPPLVLRVLARELRMLVGPAFARDQGQDPARILAEQRVPESRQAGIRRALKRLDGPPCRGLLRRRADADRAIKGLSPDDPGAGAPPHRRRPGRRVRGWVGDTLAALLPAPGHQCSQPWQRRPCRDGALSRWATGAARGVSARRTPQCIVATSGQVPGAAV
jgi:hypothetical protein